MINSNHEIKEEKGVGPPRAACRWLGLSLVSCRKIERAGHKTNPKNKGLAVLIERY